jgi:photosystem II stability/assembly factor-like uncharacterized protein
MLLAFAALWPATAEAAGQWRVQYFYDPPDGSEFSITDLAFPTAQYGIAAGELETGGRPKPYAVATQDGGKTWLPVRVPEAAQSLFFLNERTGWLVGRKHIWRTGDFGRKWTKLKSVRGARRVYFRDERRGWVAGEDKWLYQTTDGGLKWTRVEAGPMPKSVSENTVYSAIAFADLNTGVVAGWSRPQETDKEDAQPEWMEPENVAPERPGVAILLQTQDGGESWKQSATSILGQITALSLAPDGRGLLLVEFFGRFPYPSEVYRVGLEGGQSSRVFRNRNRAVTDVLVASNGTGYLAAVEPPGTLLHSPVPGKLKILQSKDLDNWTEMDVDYRAIARRAHLAASDPGNVWVATDTGMILKLASE